MLDRVYAGADRRIDSGRSVRVGRNADALHMRFVGDRAKLVFRKLLLAGGIAAGEDPASGADLDHFGAELALAANLKFELLGAIADALFLLLLLELRRKIGVVAMTSGRAQGMAGRNNARSDDIAGLYRLLQPDVDPVARADDPHGREPAIEHVARTRRCDNGPEAAGIFEKAIAADVRWAEVRMHVD